MRNFCKIVLVLGIIALFIFMSITPSVAVDTVKKPIMPISDKTVITVDDEGDGDYTSIKEALNNADYGDTIEVYSGTYYEHGIDIIKEGITLQGVSYELGNGGDTGKPFINGEGKDYVIFFDAKGITLDGFHIENWAGTQHDIIDLSRDADGCIISNNDLANTSFCFIYVKGSNNRIINNNISHSAMDDGITLRDPCSNCIVSGNTISDVETGIELWDSNHHTITGNKISRCSRFGIDIASSDYNIVKGNSIEDNTVGLQNYVSLGCRIIKNNFIDNQYQAQFIYAIPRFIGLTNRWRGNYWNGSSSRPYPIIEGYFLFIPIAQFDWFPAKEPYDIGV